MARSISALAMICFLAAAPQRSSDGDGKDTVKFGGGADHWIGSLDGGADGADIIDGGKGVDSYHASVAGVTGVAINLDNVEHFLIKAGSAVSNNAATRESIHNFENAHGSANTDTLLGTGGVNALNGLGGNDHLYGLGGKDVLTGGAGEDSFVFLSLHDSGTTKASRDVITGFEGAGVAGGDQIDLGPIHEALAINFEFLGTDVAFSGNAGEVRSTWIGSQTIVQLDADGEKKADLSIAIDGHHILAAADLILVV